MRVVWEIDDGYAGKARPQYTTISDEELEMCASEQEKEDLIHFYVGQDFESLGFTIIRKEV